MTTHEKLSQANARIREKNIQIEQLKEYANKLADALEEEFGESKDLMQSQQYPWNLIGQAREIIFKKSNITIINETWRKDQ